MSDEKDPRAAVFGANLLRLRTGKGLSQASLAERASISRVGYRNIETGASIPKADTLARLAAALDVGLEELVRPTPSLTAVRFRAQKKMATREAVVARVARWLESYNELEARLGAVKSFELQGCRDKIDRDDVEQCAADVRRALGLSDPKESIRDICGLLEDHGIKVFAPTVATDSFFGLSVASEAGGPAIVVNTWERITVERWIFTAAHELGHLMLHHEAFDISLSEEPEDEEREADRFASHFLMPREAFDSEWAEAQGLPFFDAVMKLKAIFRVSWKTVVYRLSDDLRAAGRESEAKALWAKFYKSHKRRYGRSLPGKAEPSALSAESFLGSRDSEDSPEPVRARRREFENLNRSVFREDRLHRLVRRGLSEKRISMSRGAEILQLSMAEMRDLSKEWLV